MYLTPTCIKKALIRTALKTLIMNATRYKISVIEKLHLAHLDSLSILMNSDYIRQILVNNNFPD